MQRLWAAKLVGDSLKTEPRSDRRADGRASITAPKRDNCAEEVEQEAIREQGELRRGASRVSRGEEEEEGRRYDGVA